MNAFILLFFCFTVNSDIFQSLSVTFKQFALFPKPFEAVQSTGLNAILIQNLIFTALQVSILINAYWCYKMWTYHNNYYIEKDHPFIFGIGGDSGVGKSTLAMNLGKVTGKENLIILSGDDAHKWERKDKNWKLYTHLNPIANKIHTDAEHLYALIDGKTIERVSYNHKTGKFSKPQQLSKNQFILFQGLHPFILENLRPIYDLKIYIEAEEKLRVIWKINRDSKKRGYSKAKIKQQLKKRKDDAKKFIYPQKQFADWIIRYELIDNSLKVISKFKNSIPLDSLIKELRGIKTLKITHNYVDMNYHEISYKGIIKKNDVEKIAYKLYPDIYELLNYYPSFKSDIKGIQQLLFINYLNYYYSQKVKNNERFYL